MKRTFIQTAIFLSLISLNSNLLYGDIITLNYANNNTSFKNRELVTVNTLMQMVMFMKETL